MVFPCDHVHWSTPRSFRGDFSFNSNSASNKTDNEHLTPLINVPILPRQAEMRVEGVILARMRAVCQNTSWSVVVGVRDTSNEVLNCQSGTLPVICLHLQLHFVCQPSTTSVSYWCHVPCTCALFRYPKSHWVWLRRLYLNRYFDFSNDFLSIRKYSYRVF